METLLKLWLKRLLSSFTIVVCMSGFCLNFSCTKPSSDDTSVKGSDSDLASLTSDNTKNSNSNQKPISSLSYPDDPEYYSPLTAGIFSNVINGTDNIAHVEIFYNKKPGSGDRYRFVIEGGFISADATIDSITMYGAYMNETLRSVTPPENNLYGASFTPTTVESIYDYLSDNSGYFFNNEEFDGKYPPLVEYVSGPHPLCTGNYSFALKFFEPGTNFDNAWMITKCTDEYPAPDHPLYGLFEMLEEDFISQLEYDDTWD